MEEYHKPSWMTKTDFDRLMAECGGLPICKISLEDCPYKGEKIIPPHDFNVDHIRPLSKGGDNSFSNTQTSCGHCNRVKYNKPDKFWSDKFYFDQHPNRDRYRIFQAQVGYNTILRFDKYFTRSFSQINRLLYLITGVPGAGKTHIIGAIGCAINHVRNREHQGQPRVRRILVFVKETGIRKQLAQEIAEETVKYGILPYAPSVKEMTTDSWQESTYRNADIVVSCLQQLWGDKYVLDTTEKVMSLKQILSDFDLIFFDEPHFAFDRVMAIARHADRSLVLGLTATPLDTFGSPLLEGIVHFGLYDYDSALSDDGGISKYVPQTYEELVQEIEIDNHDALCEGIFLEHQEKLSDHHSMQLWAIQSVINAVIAEMAALDKEGEKIRQGELFPRMADHRLSSKGFLPEIDYPAHAIIKVPSIQIAVMMSRYFNEKVNADRKKFPRELGWQSDAVHSGSEQHRQAKPLTPDHPWFRYKNTGKLDRKCVRVLFVVEIGKEGINNKYCVIVGLADKVRSIRETLQREFGRAIRSVTEKINGKIKVPRKELDTVKIITHEAFGNRPTIEAAIRYLWNMPDWLAEIPTLADVALGLKDATSSQIHLDGDAIFPATEKIAVTAEIGFQKLTDKDIDEHEISCRFGGGNPKKEAKIREWVETVVRNPSEARKRLGLDSDLSPLEVVVKERLAETATPPTLERFIKIQQPHLIKYLDGLSENEAALAIATTLYHKHLEDYWAGTIKTTLTLSNLRGGFADEILRQFGCQRIHVNGTLRYEGGYLEPQEDGSYSYVYAYTGKALKDLFGVDELRDRGPYDTPETHCLLQQSSVRQAIIKRVRGDCYKNGHSPVLAAALYDGGE